MPEFTFRKAGEEDIEILTEFRIRFLNDYKDHTKDEETEILERNVRDYFSRSIPRDLFVAFLAESEGEVIASSGMEIRRIAPRYGPFINGWMGYVMNMYTLPEYRRKGIASRLLELLKQEASRMNIGVVHLHASRDGAGIYEKAGFIPAELPEMVWFPDPE